MKIIFLLTSIVVFVIGFILSWLAGWRAGYDVLLFVGGYLFLSSLLLWAFKVFLRQRSLQTVVFLAESPFAVDLAMGMAKEEVKWQLKAFLTHRSCRFPSPPHQIVWQDWSEVYTLLPSLSPHLLIFEDPLATDEFTYLALPQEILSLVPSCSLVDFIVRHQHKIPVSLVSEAWMQKFFLPPSPLNRFLKRGEDLLFTFLLLPFIGVIVLATALVTKMTSAGRVIYTQRREGWQGVPFTLYKFRSMVETAETTGAQWAQANDSRVTRWGRIMRKLRLDELPQIWNVFRGDMSFVGPRPERPEFTQWLVREIPFYSLRNCVKPGLTGWAQVNYPYGASVGDALHKLEYDLYYVRNPSLWMDFKILLKTVQIVVMGKGR